MTEISSRPLSILVADDVVEIQQLVAQWLVSRGHQVTGVSTGEEAQRSLVRGGHDLVIVDVLMPDGDGLDVIRTVKEKALPTRILAISGGGKYMAGPECINLARGLGAHAVLLKPFNEQQLLQSIEGCLSLIPGVRHPFGGTGG